MEIAWDVILPPVAIISVLLFMFRWLDTKNTDTRKELKADIQNAASKLGAEIKEVRQASETAHTSILTELGNIKEKQGIHTGRFDGIDKRFDDFKDVIAKRVD
ncbi:MAG: hypothetical protein OXG02_04165 [Chloroflexi bacterium]|nr:hypothetical protein [Chloroflexota bacterium]MCY4010015.1 hypothetical protein [Anaerolineaceae bacterium]MCY4105880.1 hypothetical protein [Chloroflexota bacterium]